MRRHCVECGGAVLEDGGRALHGGLICGDCTNQDISVDRYVFKMTRRYRARHRLMRAASWLPDIVIRVGERIWPTDLVTLEGFWFDASYWKWCRRDQRKNRADQS